MNNIAKISITLASFLVISACSTNSSRPSPVDDTVRFVNSAVDPTIQSIDRSLKTLVILSRGDESPPKPGAIADTVAGSNPPKPPRNISRNTPSNTSSNSLVNNSSGNTPKSPSSSYSAASSNYPLSHTNSSSKISVLSLDTRLRMEWTGSALSLLTQISKTLGYSLSTLGPNLSKHQVSIKIDNGSVKDILEAISHQLDGKADIRVDTTRHEISLVNRQ